MEDFPDIGPFDSEVERRIKNPVLRLSVRLVLSIKQYASNYEGLSLDASPEEIIKYFENHKENQ